MKKISAMIICLMIVISSFTACQKTDDRIYNEKQESIAVSSPNNPNAEVTAKPMQEKELSGNLSLFVVAEADRTNVVWAERFMEKHPKVHIETNSILPKNAGLPPDLLEKITSRSIVSLTSGTAEDVMEVSNITYRKFSKSGLLTNFYDLMEQDPAFKKDDYYTNVFQAFESEDGGLYAFPTHISCWSFVFNKLITEDLGIDMEKDYADGISPSQIMKLYCQAVENGIIAEGTDIADGANPEVFDLFTTSGFVDEKTQKASFDTPEYVDLLKLTNTVTWPAKNGDPVAANYLNANGFYTKTYFFAYSSPLMSEIGKMEESPLENSTKPVFVLGENGEIPLMASFLYAIPTSTQNLNLAWEFLQFITEEKDFPEKLDCYNYDDIENFKLLEEFVFPYNGLPINRNTCRKLLNACWGNEIMEKYDSFILRYNSAEPYGYELITALSEIKTDYFINKTITAEACAKKMQERADMFINE